MSVSNPAFRIARETVVGHEGEWVKMFDPPTMSPVTPENLAPTNPVPAFVAAAVPGAGMAIANTVSLRLMRGRDITMWDGVPLPFFTIADNNVPAAAAGVWPGPTIRIPRGVIYHAETQGAGPPPHTIHWHGIEPTPINDGVGHCSMEVGQYTYQWQPNHIGTYFYHCHRNTVQHFDYGLYGLLLIEPPNAFNTDPINAGGPPKDPRGYPRRTAANLGAFPQFPGFVGGALTSGDPHAMTVPYDVEAAWVLDDVDSAWRTLAPGARDTFPAQGPNPGVDDLFHENAAAFFAFHDFNPNYFFATSVPFKGAVGSTAADLAEPGDVGYPLGNGTTLPPDLNSGVSGMQVAVNAQVNQTVLVRILNGAYSVTKITFPVDVVIIAFDGRALGVPPFGNYNRPFLLPAGTPIEITVARRFDALIRSATPVTSFATVEFIHNRDRSHLLTGRIPIVIGEEEIPG